MKESLILLREDDDTLFQLMTEFIAQTIDGYKVIRVQKLSEILGLPELSDAELLITDLFGPGGYGVDIIRGLRERHIHLPVLVISGNITDKAKGEMEELGIKYLKKGFPLHVLAEHLYDLIGKRNTC
ncbi:MAG: hypothetical protein A2142_07085 [candidate division Zixibacteria bacterium RBG_16_48_11]|nr:MAG: hypothetical protein A2142_07085 [candidate division Zixibacteria bacterium RBG_16_48_11]